MNPKCTACDETMSFLGVVAKVESYFCEDCGVEGHINLNQAA